MPLSRIATTAIAAATLLGAGIVTFAMSSPMQAQSQPDLRASSGPVLVELFTSQSCSSCPPAEALFRDYAKRADLVTLEWHVDYWDDLNVGAAGRWKDPYSRPQWTARQRAYNERIRGQSGVYTPQVIIAGTSEAVGSRPADITPRIADAARAPASPVVISAMSGKFAATASVPPGAQLWLATFRDVAETNVAGGENYGRKLNSAHLVTAFRSLRPGEAFAPPAAGEGCAVILQGENQGRVLGAAYCPATK